jgi:hypothetical protein
MIKNKYEIDEIVIDKESDRQLMIEYYEVHEYEKKEYIVYICNEKYGFRTKRREFELRSYNDTNK